MEDSRFSDTPKRDSYDAVVIGSGPNGLAAAITLARAGASVLVVEGAKTPGGGTRTEELTLPGFLHDVCSAIHPMGLASPCLQELDLEAHGLVWIQPDLPVVHPLEGGRAVVQEREVEATADRLGRDGPAYRRLFGPLVRNASKLYADLLGPLRLPRHPVAVTRFGCRALLSARILADTTFRTEEAKALLAGHAAHSVLPLEQPGTAAYALMLGVSAHAVGWPIARGGSRSITGALLSVFRQSGGEVVCGWPVRRIEELPRSSAYVFDTSPGAMAAVCGDRLPSGYRRALARFRHGPGVFKVDWALASPVPWSNPECRRTACVHLGGTFGEIAASERAAWEGRACERPFLIVTQPSLVDDSRAPAGQHTAWAYAHVPNGSGEDFLERIESQMERFAPGFRDCILGRHVMGPGALEGYNPNCVGGDVTGGAQDLAQLYGRPVFRLDPYATPAKDIFIGSASTPPGAGVHGMCGHHAARSVLRRWRMSGHGVGSSMNLEKEIA